MIDLHTHILHGIDDGAENLSESIRMLQAQAADGVQAAALTPHFRTGTANLENFISARYEAAKELYYKVKETQLPIGLVLGAEVLFSASLLDINPQPLCYDGTKTMLIELPADHCPPYLREVFSGLINNGYTPMIAHIERYPYFVKNLNLLKILTDGGVLTQVNTISLETGSKTCRRVLAMIKEGLVHTIATDMHSADRCPLPLSAALSIIKHQTGIDMTVRMQEPGL